MKSINQCLFYTVCLFLFNSCYKNVDDFESMLQDDKPVINVNAEIVGRVLDSKGAEVNDYSITMAGIDLKIDKSPLFHFNKTNVKKTGERITVNKDGKEYNYVIFPIENTITYVEFTLVETQIGSSFISTESYQTSIDSDTKLYIENAQFKRDNIDFTGDITLNNEVINLNAQFNYCPNTNLSQDKAGHKSFLLFEKIFNLGVVEPNGNLFIQKGATLAISKLNTNEKLYHFDSTIGFWVPMDEINNSGSNLKFDINEFGFYAIAKNTSIRFLQGKLYSKNIALPNAKISLLVNNIVQHEGFTSYDGSFFMPIPQGQSVSLSITNECGSFERIIDKGVDDVNGIKLDWNEIDVQSIPLKIYDCSNKLTSNSIVKIQNGANIKYFYSELGETSIALPTCLVTSTSNITVGDESWIEVGSSKKIKVNTNYNKLFVCSQFKGEYMAYDINGASRVEWKAESILESGNIVNLMPSLISSTKFKYILRFSPLIVGNISDIQITIYDEDIESKGYSIDCKTGDQSCKFEEFIIEEAGSKPGDIISGHFKGNFSVNTITPEGVEDAIIQGDFQVVRDF